MDIKVRVHDVSIKDYTPNAMLPMSLNKRIDDGLDVLYYYIKG